MAISTMYLFLEIATPDYATTTLTVTPQEVIVEDGQFNQEIHLGADGSEEVVTYSTTPIFYVTLLWPQKSEADIGTIFDFYFDTLKAKGVARSFKWDHDGDGHTYVVKFRDKLTRSDYVFKMGINSVRLKVIGKVTDA